MLSAPPVQHAPLAVMQEAKAMLCAWVDTLTGNTVHARRQQTGDGPVMYFLLTPQHEP